MKILYVTTIGITMTFFKDLIKELLDEGHTVDIICNEEDEKVPDCYREWNCNIYHHSCSRSPLAKGNLQAVRQIKKLVKREKYDIVHCHTPVAAMCTRLACKSLRKQGVRVMYTAHGFHFYKGAQLKNWLLYFPVEWISGFWTDVLITINTEDYLFSQKHIHARKVEYVPGVGIDIKKFENFQVNRNEERDKLGIQQEDILILSVGELNKNKNHQIVIRAIAKLKKKNVYYFIAGEGKEKEQLINLAESLEIREKIIFLGYCNEVQKLYKLADIYILPSFREGLNVSIMEAMICKKPVICGRIRGNKDLIDEKGGIMFNPNNLEECCKAIEIAISLELKKMGEYNCEKMYNFSREVINTKMRKLYEL